MKMHAAVFIWNVGHKESFKHKCSLIENHSIHKPVNSHFWRTCSNVCTGHFVLSLQEKLVNDVLLKIINYFATSYGRGTTGINMSKPASEF